MHKTKLQLNNFETPFKDIIRNKISLIHLDADLFSIKKQIQAAYILRCEKLV